MVENKWQRAIRQMNVSGRMKGNATRDKRETPRNISREQKNMGGNTMEIALLNENEPLGEGLELVRGTEVS